MTWRRFFGNPFMVLGTIGFLMVWLAPNVLADIVRNLGQSVFLTAMPFVQSFFFLYICFIAVKSIATGLVKSAGLGGNKGGGGSK